MRIAIANIAAVTVAAAALTGCGGSPDDDAPNDAAFDSCGPTEQAKRSAYGATQVFMDRILVAPSTSRYPIYSDSEMAVFLSADCVYRIDAYVDAQNSFGVMVRTHFMMEVEHVDGGYKVVDYEERQ